MNEAQKRGYRPVTITEDVGGWSVGSVAWHDPATLDMCWNANCTRCWAHIPGDSCEYLPPDDETPEADAPSLRDEFAMRALVCIKSDNVNAYAYDMAVAAYAVADAMLKVRKGEL